MSSLLKLSTPPEINVKPEVLMQTNSAVNEYVELPRSFFDYVAISSMIHKGNANICSNIVIPDKENSYQYGEDYIYYFHHSNIVTVSFYVNAENPKLVKHDSSVFTKITGYIPVKDTEILLYETATIQTYPPLPFKLSDLKRYKKLRCETYCFNGQTYAEIEIPIQKIADIIENNSEYFTTTDTSNSVISDKFISIVLNAMCDRQSFFLRIYVEDYSTHKKGDIILSKHSTTDAAEVKIKIYGVL